MSRFEKHQGKLLRMAKVAKLWPGLEVLHLTWLGERERDLSWARQLSCLARLSLICCPITNLSALASLALRRLDLSAALLTKAQILSLGQLTTLENLALKAVAEVDDDVLRSLLNLVRLRVLDLSYLPLITDKGVGSLEGLPLLEQLDLTCTKVTRLTLTGLTGLLIHTDSCPPLEPIPV
jgi:Leucine-rich repeat (LRR) protein